ncbi:MAG TPA: Ppx/GppA phosphatase family protein [Lacipirellulaceae bacterium]|jgi:exopolyphosphatase/guanosine-5'-triphosphate,3'-diphosphate pyrophosphatase
MVDTENSAGEPASVAERIAAIDVGSNSVRLVVAEVLPSGGYRVLDEERENTRLSAALVKTGELAPTAVETTIAALKRFQSIATGYGVGQIRAIATSAVRDANNGPDFCLRVRRELRLELDVISSDEEARLAFLSVARAFDVSGREVAVTDIGGGSTEIILASSGLVDQMYTTSLGAVRVAEQCGVTDICDEKQLERLRRFIDRTLKKQVGKPPFVPSMFYGTGGTFTALAAMIMAREGQSGQPMWGYRVTGAQIRHLLSDLAQLPLDKRGKTAGLNPARADIIVSGLAIIERIMVHLHVNVVQVHTRGVRDGLLLTMIQSSHGAERQAISSEARLAAVEQFAKSCGVDLTFAKQVARIAGSLWEQLATPLDLRPADRELIEAAALLANVGYLINFEGHHKHSYHLILNSELPGFEREQLRMLALAARYHRGSRPKKKHDEYKRLTEEDKRRASALAAILRLALALDRTHQQHVETVKASVGEGGVEIAVRAHGDADVDLWAARGKVKLFEKVFGREVLFSVNDTSGRRAPGKGRTRSSPADGRRSGKPKSDEANDAQTPAAEPSPSGGSPTRPR